MCELLGVGKGTYVEGGGGDVWCEGRVGLCVMWGRGTSRPGWGMSEGRNGVTTGQVKVIQEREAAGYGIFLFCICQYSGYHDFSFFCSCRLIAATASVWIYVYSCFILLVNCSLHIFRITYAITYLAWMQIIIKIGILLA